MPTTRSYTEKQGRYLAFIHFYTRVNGQPPAQVDMQKYFRVTPPTVHQMVLTLEKNGLIERTPRQPRSIRVIVPTDPLHTLL
jgi:repressor LexA